MKRPLLDATCRVAFAGLIHDLGKFAQRAKIDVAQSSLQLHQQIYCPQRQEGGRISTPPIQVWRLTLSSVPSPIFSMETRRLLHLLMMPTLT